MVEIIMKDKSLLFKSAVLVVLLNSLIFQAVLIAAERPEDIENMPLEDIVHFMTRTHPRKDLLSKIINKANTEPAFRKDLVNALTKRLSEATAISNTVRSLRDLNALEVLPQLKKIWNETEKKTYYLSFADRRIQLVITIAEFLSETERIKFLIDTESDTAEAPKVRFRATILLCATGNEKAIEHVLSVYEQAKQQFPLTTYMLLEDQKEYIERMEERDNNRNPWDSDRDFISSYIETGLLLDPDNIDTDGDGLIDGNDRNPLCKPQKGEFSEDQLIAHFILYLHARYHRISRSPFDFKLLIVRPVDTWDGTEKHSFFDSMQFTGIEGLILQMNKKQIDKFRAIHGPGTSAISLHKLSKKESDQFRAIRGPRTPAIGIHKMLESKDQKDIKEFSLSISGGSGQHRTYNITFKRFNNVWLPIFWELGMIT